ncbi:MAG: DUF1343 domain-containing protein [Armatimonadetes bacterium]|nr:DUF1343 domain-containing protein [Armatimonadota bacterium]MDE2205226.1 DUF1343 domain-containing protein [Armatimonadota bacterium]
MAANLNPVSTGIDALAVTGFKLLRGKQCGLVTNHTGLSSEGRRSADLLHHAPNVQLHALFSPEHGLEGVLDTGVADTRDSATGLPVYSLYGKTDKPSPEQLRGLDTLVYDIQDIGARYYTYISTLGLCMEAAAEHGLMFVVLDRPNPIGGLVVEGPEADSDRLSFTAFHPMPVRHGMTVGELAGMFHTERPIGVNLHVERAAGWRRSMFWDETNLLWINPSPNIRCFNQALLYPGIGLLEPTNVSVGRGTDTPFEIVGAPFIDGRVLAARLRAERLPGVVFVPTEFRPNSSIHAGALCRGISLQITSREALVPVLTGVAIAAALRDLYPSTWRISEFNRLLVNRAAFERFRAGADPEELVHSWYEDDHAFAQRRKPFLLYE